ncbi:MFS transporter [Saccharospirillum salsuginis]|uniref:MFS transporter n=1 Tax=Saccharospirillum salsuginis TaxID=418750 RepID=A0A918KMI2_9GAMM|nr:MFS transporter [Saccharospirillum salsuginis]GGX66698.1 MFS transporter [Saccharospirillum salsuginis]
MSTASHSEPSTAKHRSALSEPVFRLYFFASCCATLAVWIVRFLIGWTAWELTRSAFWVGTVSVMLLAPTIFLSPVFGVVSDRVDPRNGMVTTAACNIAICLTIVGLSAQDWLTIVALLSVALAFGCVTAAHHPMRLSLMPKILARDLLPSGIGLSAIVFNTSRIIGPAIGAWILGAFGAAWAFALSALLFSATLGLLTRVPSAPPVKPEEPESLLTDLRAGFRFIGRAPLIQLILLMTLVNGLVGRTVMELLPAISGELAGGTAGALATLTAVAGAGSIVGGWVISRQRGNTLGISRLVFVALLTGSLVLIPVVWLQGLAFLIPVVIVSALSMTIIGTGCQALVQLVVSDAFRGRIMSVWTVVSMGGPAFGAFLMGAVADVFGFGATFIGFALAAILTTFGLWQQRQRFQQSE